MYKSFRVENFRGFDDLTLESLQRVNLIAGKNNVGKTTLLEALWLHHGYYNPELGLRLRVFRGLDRLKREEFMWDLFSGFDPEKTIALSSWDQDNQEHTLIITIHEHAISRVSLREGYPAEGYGSEAGIVEKETTTPIESEVRFQYTGGVEAHAFVETDGVRFERPSGIKAPSAVFRSAQQRDKPEVLAERFGNLAIDKKEKRITEILNAVDPRLKGLAVQYRGGSPVIYCDVGKTRLVPLPLMGDGLGRLLGIALAIPEAQNGLLLIDEVENGLHYSVMKDVWKAIGAFARDYDVQIFATTHSYECVRAAHRAFAESESYDFMLHRLDRVNGKVKVVAYTQQELEIAIREDIEVR